MNPAVFLDRDGVLIQDMDLLSDPKDIRILPGVPVALKMLMQAGFRLFVVTNQTVVARGISTIEQVVSINNEVLRMVVEAGGPLIEGCYFCPHHPNATRLEYRQNCQCRKPRPGMLLQASREHDLDLMVSYFIGDRVTDVIAGRRAGCQTVLLETGMHRLPPIESSDLVDTSIQAHFACADLKTAARWILRLN